MNQISSGDIKKSLPDHSDIINFRRLTNLVIGNWYYFVIVLVVAVVAAYFYNKLTLQTYRVSTTILIEEGESSRLPGIDNTMLEGFGLRSGAQNLDNQIIVLSSWKLISNTLSELQFETDYYKKGLFKEVSFYPLNPIDVIPGSETNVPYGTEFSFQFYDGEIFNLCTSPKSEYELDTFISFGQQVNLNQGSVTIHPYPEMENIYKSKNKVFFKFYNLESLTYKYRKRLSVQNASKDGTIITLSLEGTNKAKDIVFLDKLTEVYLRSNLEKKNHEANRIVQFIDEQLVDVSDSLMITELQLQNFRSENRIMNVSAQAQQIIDQAVVLENEKARLTLESNYFNYLDEYLSKENNQDVPISPSTMGIADPLLGMLMQELSGFQAEYFSSGVGERNPLQAQLELKIKNTKQSLRETLQGIKLANNMARDENNEQINILNSQASRLPIKERQLLGIERKFNLNNVLYTYLLQKRAEAQIQKASNRADYELLDSARADLTPTSPSDIKVYIFAILLGLGITFFIVILGETIHNKISSEEDLKRISDLPIVGHIPHSRLSYNTVVLNEPQSRVAESFRSLRTRMEFFTKDAICPIILVSSSMPGDGKSFAAVNLASAYSLAGKKTLLIGFDLRRPTLSKSFETNGENGLSTYLIGKTGIDSIIFDTGFPNLHIIPSGPIPPNPGELSSSEKAKQLLTSLRDRYDFIVVDTAPIGTVSDNYSVASIADVTLMMVRHGQTNKHFLGTTLDEAKDYGIKGLSLLVNDVRSNRSSYRYAYNYNYKQKKV